MGQSSSERVATCSTIGTGRRQGCDLRADPIPALGDEWPLKAIWERAGRPEICVSAIDARYDRPSWGVRPALFHNPEVSYPPRLRGAGLLITVATFRMVSRCSGSRAR